MNALLSLLPRTLVATTRKRPRAMLRLAAWSVLEAAPTFVFGHAVARTVDGFLDDRPAAAGAWLALLALAGLAGAMATGRLYASLGAIVEPFRDELTGWVVRGALHRSTAGRPDSGAVARLTHQVEIVRDTFAGVLMVIRGFVFSVTGALLGLLTLMPIVLVLVVPPLLLALGIFFAIVGPAAARQRELILGEERIAERTTAMAEGLRDVVACGGEDELGTAIGKEVDAQAAAARAVARVGGIRVLALSVGGWGPLLLVIGGAPWLMRNGATAGTVIGALTYVQRGLQPALRTLVQGVGGSGLRLVVTLSRIMEAGPSKPALPQTAKPDGLSSGAIELHDVTFAYGPHADPVIESLDLQVPAGDHLAVVGPSGIGKSTLAALIAGLLVPQSGTVRVDREPPGDPRQRVLIPQEAYVFTGTLRDNLTYLAPGADPEPAVAAIGLAELVERVGGYDTPLDPEALSAGERQLVALARAYLAAQPLVILDEATCHLDPAAEARAEAAFADRAGTLIVIAHRITSALRARRVLVLDGTAARLGGHEELLRRSPLYRDLVGHWTPPGTVPAGSEPAGGLGDANGVHAVAGAGLAVDAGEVVADRADGEDQGPGDLLGRGALRGQP